MQVCYIDESGDTGKFVPEVANSQPLFVLSGIVVDQQFLPEMTCSVIELKRKFFPNHGNLNTHWHDWLKSEVKGSYLRQKLNGDSPTWPPGESKEILRLSLGCL